MRVDAQAAEPSDQEAEGSGAEFGGGWCTPTPRISTGCWYRFDVVNRYKVQDLSGKLKTEKRNLVSLESTVRENLKKEFQDQISELNSQLTVVKGQFAEYVVMLARGMCFI